MELKAELEALAVMVDSFAAAMKSKLYKKAGEGWHGWNDDSNPEIPEILWQRLREHVERGPGQEIDIANFAAMLWNLAMLSARSSIAAASEAGR